MKIIFVNLKKMLIRNLVTLFDDRSLFIDLTIKNTNEKNTNRKAYQKISWSTNTDTNRLKILFTESWVNTLPFSRYYLRILQKNENTTTTMKI